MRCINCFTEIGADSICSSCGYDLSEYHCPEACLAPRIIIGGRYEIGRVIGEGGFGITYAAYDKTLGSKCAVKEYFPRGLSSRTAGTEIKAFSDTADEYSNGLRHFKQEAAKLAKFDGIRNIVNVKNYIGENNTGYIIMNFVEGISLKEYLENNGGRLSPERAFTLIAPIISALDKIEREGIIHRDISPDNLILSADDELVLIDFGSAREYNADKSMTVILKHGYAPPEQYTSVGAQGPWTDIYALCATIYKMITGAIPPDAMERLGGNAKPIPISKLGVRISKQREKAIMKGLSVNAGERFISANELYDALYRQEQNDIKIGRLIPTAVLAAVCVLTGVFFILPKNSEEITAVEAADFSVQTESVQTSVPEEDIYADIAFGELENGSWYITYDGVLNINAEGRLETDSKTWFEYRHTIKRAVLSDSITEIGDGAFKRISSLEKVTFPEKLTYIGAEAFSHTSLTEVNIPDSVEYIGENAFFGTDIKNIELPSKELYMGANAFGSCDKLESVVFPAGFILHSNLDEQFVWGRSLSDIYLSDGITNDAAESIIRSLKREPSSYYNVHFPDNTEISDELISEFPEYITAVGKSSCPAVKKLAEEMYSVEFTDDNVPEFYVTRGTLYINSDQYTKNESMEIIDTGSSFATNLTYQQFCDGSADYNSRIKEYFDSLYADRKIRVSSMRGYTDCIVVKFEYFFIRSDPKGRVPDTAISSSFVDYNDYTKNIIKYFTDDDCVVIKYSDSPKKAAAINNIIFGSNVTRLEETCLSDYSNARSVFIPRTVTYISDNDLGYVNTIYTTPNDIGYIEEYAEKYNIDVEYVENAEEMINKNT